MESLFLAKLSTIIKQVGISEKLYLVCLILFCQVGGREQRTWETV